MQATPSGSPRFQFPKPTLFAVILGLAAAAVVTAAIVERPTLSRPGVGTAQAATLPAVPGDPSVPSAASVFEGSSISVEEPTPTF